MSRRERDKPSRRLIESIGGSTDLGVPHAVLTTTFDLNNEFFETDFLPALVGLRTMDDRRPQSRLALEGELAKMEAVALLCEGSRFQLRPKFLRVDVRPAVALRGGVLHAKVTVMVHADAVRVLVASANLTTGGYRQNREVALMLTADKKNPEATPLIRQLLAEMPTRLAPWWSEAAAKVVECAGKILGALPVGPVGDEVLLWGGGDPPLWKRFLELWPAGEIVKAIHIVSPFWSEETGKGPLSQLVNALRARNQLVDQAKVLLVTAALADKALTYLPTLPQSYGVFDARTLGVMASVQAAKPQVDEEDVGRDDLRYERQLHAKVLLLEGEGISLAYAGSANFTMSGWGFGAPSAANIEAGIVLRRRGKAALQLRDLIPPVLEPAVPLNGAASGSIRTPCPDDTSLAFPDFISSAELRTSATDSQRLELVIDVLTEHSPAWSVALDVDAAPLLVVEGELLLRSSHRLPLSPAELKQLVRQPMLHIEWSVDGVHQQGVFPVNVTPDVRQELPFGDADSAPGEDQLVAFYQGRIAWEDVFPLPPEESGEDAALPQLHETSVDTSRILSYQVRAFVEALHGIRQSLQDLRDTNANEPTIRLALKGPVSPTALARQIYTAVVRDGRSSTAGAFQLVELLACLCEAQSWTVAPSVAEAWKTACAAATNEVGRLLGEVRARDGERLGPATSFDGYARAIAPTAAVDGVVR